MPSRRLPQSDAQRQQALFTAKRKNDNLPVGTVVLLPATSARLTAFEPDWAAKLTLRDLALNLQTLATSTVVAARNALRTAAIQFFKTFNNGVSLGTFPAQDRMYYGLPVSQDSVPDMSNEEKLDYWCQKIITGDPLRVAAGGTAMAFPTIIEFTAKYDAYEAAKIDQSNKKDAYNAAQEVVEALRDDADLLVLNIWDEVEAHYNTGDIESKRRQAREWGVVYVSKDAEYSMTGHVTDLSGNPLEDVLVKLVEPDVSDETNSFGEYNIPVVAAGTYTVEVSREGFQTQTIPGIVIEAGVVKVLDVQMVSLTGNITVNVESEGAPLADATVEIVALGISELTNDDGQAFLNYVTPGTWDVAVSKEGYAPQTQPVTIQANQTVILSFELTLS